MQITMKICPIFLVSHEFVCDVGLPCKASLLGSERDYPAFLKKTQINEINK